MILLKSLQVQIMKVQYVSLVQTAGHREGIDRSTVHQPLLKEVYRLYHPPFLDFYVEIIDKITNAHAKQNASAYIFLFSKTTFHVVHVPYVLVYA